jgi:hypothetical protein
MTRSTSDTVRGSLQRLLPIVIPIALFVIGYLWFVQPWNSAGFGSRTEAQGLESRASSLAALIKKAGVVEKAPPDETIREFQRLVPADSRVSDLVELVAKLALEPPNSDEARGLLVESGQRTVLNLATAGSAFSMGFSDQGSDPRLALFAPIALEYTPVTVSFEATYDRIGIFLWRLRELPTFAEVRSLEVTRALPLLKVKLVLLVYQRGSTAVAPGQPAPPQGQPGPKVADSSTPQTNASHAVGLP